MAEPTIQQSSDFSIVESQTGTSDLEIGAANSRVEMQEPSSTTNDSLHTQSHLATTEHLGKHREYWRDIILGVNDGLVSTFLLVAGVAGAGLTMTDILLTAIAGALAGAVSMSAGEYIATKSQNEVFKGEIELERSHIEKYKNQEIEEVSALLEVIGIAPEETHLREQMISYYESHPEALLKIMVALEFGVTQTGERSPLTAALFSGMLFVAGSLPSVLPFLARKNSTSFISLVVAAVATCIALLLVGMIKTWATRGNCFTAAIENLAVAGIGGAFAYGVGVLFDIILN